MKLSGVDAVNFSFVAVCLTIFLRPSTAQDASGLDENQYVTADEWSEFVKWQASQNPHALKGVGSRWNYAPNDDYDFNDDDFDDYYDDEDYPGLSQPRKTQNSPLDDWFNQICSKTPCNTLFGDDVCNRLGRFAGGHCKCITLEDHGLAYIRRGRCGIPLPGYDWEGHTERVNAGTGLAVRPLSDNPVLDPYPCCCNGSYTSFGCCYAGLDGIVHEPAQFQLPIYCGKGPSHTD
jgi:hypothetical protein